ncbi:hypothetical protein LJR235_005376 [Pararhizobium sp. LjRoot235]|uniref:hypothetical protein n=1 Tax=Pararhizobium sp. LjRoot235 TaxID=3342291 RepID=UPI003ED1487D
MPRTAPKPALPYLKSMLSHTDDLRLLRMFWAIHALQGRKHQRADKFLDYPPQAESPGIGSKFAVYPWDLETLIGLTLTTPKAFVPPWRQHPVDTKQFNTVVELVNTLRAVEEDESEVRIQTSNILLEMHRIGHRQFAWQRGWVRSMDVYRYLYIYGQGLCAEHFQKTHGLSILDFFGVCFALYAVHVEKPWISRINGVEEMLHISSEAVEKAISLVSGERWQVRRGATDLLDLFEERLKVNLPVIYRPSYLRIKPLIRTARAYDDLYCAPLPELLMMRGTLGLYYDIASGGTPVTNDANARFEEYARRAIRAQCPEFNPAPAEKYVYKKNNIDTPDILLKKDGVIVSVFECKATKLTFEAQYGEDPVENAKAGYSQMAKAVFQLWKFFSHVRRGIVKLDVADNATGIVLTMEAWTQMAGDLRAHVVEEANALVAEKETEIEEQDKRRPVFCQIQELDELLTTCTPDELLETFRVATDDRYAAWGVRELRRDFVPRTTERKPFPFDLGEILPWWKKVGALKAAKLAAQAGDND